MPRSTFPNGALMQNDGGGKPAWVHINSVVGYDAKLRHLKKPKPWQEVSDGHVLPTFNLGSQL